jgi:hypothetical protein
VRGATDKHAVAIYDDKWFEFWYSDGEHVVPHYFLIVTPDTKNLGKINVLDPLKNNEVAFCGKNYDEVTDWLWEDDFTLVDGRIFPDDGWPLNSTRNPKS